MKFGIRTKSKSFACPGIHISEEELLDKINLHLEGTPFRLDGNCFHGIHFKGKVDLHNIYLVKSCFIKAELNNARFDDAKLCGSDFSRAKLVECKFNNADLRGCKFIGANLSKSDLTEAKMQLSNLQGTDLTGTVFKETLINHSAFGRMIDAERKHQFLLANEIYEKLRKNFEEIGDHDSVSWAYYREKVTEFKSYSLKYAGENYRDWFDLEDSPSVLKLFYYWFKNRSWWNWLNGLIQYLLWGFAQKPLRVLFWGIMIIGVFTFVYWKGNLINYLDLETGNMIGITSSWVDNFLYSAAAFSTSSIPSLIGANKLAHLLASVEGILGVSTLALFTTSLAAKLGLH